MIDGLRDLGLSTNEATVYTSLIGTGRQSAADIIRFTNLHRKVVYENLDRLINRGLVTFVVEGNHRTFQLAPPHMLTEMVDKQAVDIERKKNEAKKIAETITRSYKLIHMDQTVVVARGHHGIRMFYHELLVSRKDYLVIGGPSSSLEIMGEHFWRNFLLNKNKKHIYARILFNTTLRTYGDSIRSRLTKIRYLSREFEPQTETVIQGSRVGIIVWTQQPVVFIIDDPVVAESYRGFFEKLWREH